MVEESLVALKTFSILYTHAMACWVGGRSKKIMANGFCAYMSFERYKSDPFVATLMQKGEGLKLT
jgi:hypothetical protein